MKKPTGATPIPLINPVLGDRRCLLTPGRAARFCQLTLQSMGSNLARFSRQNALPPAFVARLLAEEERPCWADKPWQRYGEHLGHTLSKLGYPTAVVWLSEERTGSSRGARAVFWALQLSPGKARRFANVEKESNPAPTARSAHGPQRLRP